MLTHVTDPRVKKSKIEAGKWISPVHILNPNDKNKSLCGLAHVTRIYSGIKVKILYPTDQPVNCHACGKSLEIAMRQRLALFSVDELEQVINNTNGLFFKGSDDNG